MQQSLYHLIVVVFACCFCAPTTLLADSPYTLGVVLPLSGDSAALGRYMRNGVELALEQRKPEEQALLAVFFEDDQLRAPLTVAAFQKLVSVNGASAVFTFSSGIGNAIAPLAEQKKILHVAIAASDKKVVIGREYSFTHWVSPEAEMKALVKEVQRRGYQRLAVLSAEQEGFLALERAFLAELKNQNLPESIVVLRDAFSPENKDFRTFVTKARNLEVDGIYVGTFPGALASFAKQAKVAGLNELFGVETFEDQHEVEASEGALVGKWYVNASNPSDEFVTAYKKKFGDLPGFASANAYDITNILIDALSAVGGENKKIVSYFDLLKDYHGATGVYSATGDHRFALPAMIKVVTNAGFEPLTIN